MTEMPLSNLVVHAVPQELEKLLAARDCAHRAPALFYNTPIQRVCCQDVALKRARAGNIVRPLLAHSPTRLNHLPAVPPVRVAPSEWIPNACVVLLSGHSTNRRINQPHHDDYLDVAACISRGNSVSCYRIRDNVLRCVNREH